MMDSASKLFGNDMTLRDILMMDIEDFKDAVEIRSEQRRKSLERYRQTGEKDLYISQEDTSETLMQLMAALMVNGGATKGPIPVDPRFIKLPNQKKKESVGQREFWKRQRNNPSNNQENKQ